MARREYARRAGKPEGHLAMHLLLTNDDGIDAEGLAALEKAAAGLGELTVVAPAEVWSSRGHAVTLGSPLRIVRRDDRRFAVEGSPADCVRLALHHLAGEADWVLAGINAGANLGADVHYSGTVAAAREAALHGRRAVAISHFLVRGRPILWDRAAEWTARVLRRLEAEAWRPGTLWNVNLPHPDPGGPEPEIVACPLDPSPLPLSFAVDGEFARYNGDYQRRPRCPGCDVEVCFGGRISVSLLPLSGP